MKVMAAGKAKNSFGWLIDTARSKPATIEKHERSVAVVLSEETYERLRARTNGFANESEDEVLAGPSDQRFASSRLIGAKKTEGRPP